MAERYRGNVTIPARNLTAYGINDKTQAIETIADDSIVTFAGAPNDFRLHICYSTKTGEQLWSFDRTEGNRQYPPWLVSGRTLMLSLSDDGSTFAHSLAQEANYSVGIVVSKLIMVTTPFIGVR